MRSALCGADRTAHHSAGGREAYLQTTKILYNAGVLFTRVRYLNFSPSDYLFSYFWRYDGLCYRNVSGCSMRNHLLDNIETYCEVDKCYKGKPSLSKSYSHLQNYKKPYFAIMDNILCKSILPSICHISKQILLITFLIE